VADWWRCWRADFFGVSALVGFVLAYLSPAAKDGWSFGSFDRVIPVTSLGTGTYPFGPHNWLSSDSVTQMVPFNTFDWTAIHHLQFPLWNDLSLLGLPQFLNFQSAVLSLPDLTSYLVPLRFAFLVVVAMKLLIAGTGAYALCRVLGLRPLASVLGGVVYMLSGAFSSWLTWPLSGVVAWLGWIAALAILSYRWKGKRSYVVLLALAIAFCVYGGFPEAYFFVAAALISFFVALAVVTLAQRRRLSLSGVVRVAAGIVAGGVLSAPLWFPGLQVVKGSHRETLTGFAGVNAGTLGLLVAPGYYGLPIKGSAWFYSYGNYYETVVYVGVIALVLAGAAVLRWWRHPAVIALVVMVVVTLLISYQTKSFHVLSDLLRHSRLDSVVFSRMRSVVGLPIGVLSALGLETLMRARGERRMLIAYWALSAIVATLVGLLWYGALKNNLAGYRELRLDSLWWPIGLVETCVLAGGLLLLACRLARRRSARVAVVAAVAVLFGAETAFLVFSGVGINSYSESFFPVTPAIARLKAVVGSGLVGIDTGAPSQPRLIAHAAFYPEVNLGYELAEFAAYDPIIPQAYFTFRGGQQNVEPDIDSAALARRYGIAWILQAPQVHPIPPAGTHYVGSFAGERLYAVPGTSRFSLIADRGSGVSEPVSLVSHSVTSSWTFTIDASTPSRLIMRVTDYPGWNATVDGRALSLSGYDGLMLQAAVPAGRNVIHLWYLPERLLIGTWLALAAFAVLLAWAAWPLVRRRSRLELVRADLGESLAPELEKAEIASREPARALQHSTCKLHHQRVGVWRAGADRSRPASPPGGEALTGRSQCEGQ
jgi:hypothetical protein